MLSNRITSLATIAILLVVSISVPAPARADEGTWSKLPTMGTGPQNRSKPSAAAVGENIYLFGGVEDDFNTFTNTFYNDIHRFNTSTSTWEKMLPEGALPDARAFAACAARKKEGEVVVYGGSSYDAFFIEFEVFGDLWVYSVDDNAWTEIIAENAGPGRRNAANIWADGDKLYLFGGLTPTFLPANDLWEYDFETNRWTELIPNFAPGTPTGRNSAYGGGAPKQGKLTIYGGETIDFSTFELHYSRRCMATGSGDIDLDRGDSRTGSRRRCTR